MKTNLEGKEIIRRYGYGCKSVNDKKLDELIATYEYYLNFAVDNHYFDFEVNENQYSAIISFLEDVGVDLLSSLNNKNEEDVAYYILDYINPKLDLYWNFQRRKDEYKLFIK